VLVLSTNEGKAPVVVPLAVSISAVAGGMASAVLSGPSCGNATNCGSVHGPTVGQSASGGSASRDTASSEAMKAARARTQCANLFMR
jgi:hypothetical protein